MMDPAEVAKKIAEYESFLEGTLKSDLKQIQVALEDRVEKHKEWEEVKQVVKTLTEFNEKDRDLSVRFPIGNGVHANGEVNDFERTYIAVGLGYMLEMERGEAEKYAEIRARSLAKEIEHFRKLAANIKVNIKMVLLAVSELQNSSK